MMMMGRRNMMMITVATSVRGRTILMVASVPHPIVPVVVVTMIIILRMYGIIDIIFHPVSVPVLSRYIALFGRAIVVEEEVVVQIPPPPTHIPSKHRRFRNRRKRFVVLGNLPYY
jgi:hypothetical protein